MINSIALTRTKQTGVYYSGRQGLEMARLNLIPLAFGEMIPVINNPRGASIKRYNTPIHAKLISVLAKEYRKR